MQMVQKSNQAIGENLEKLHETTTASNEFNAAVKKTLVAIAENEKTIQASTEAVKEISEH